MRLLSSFLDKVGDSARRNDIAVIDTFGSITYGELDSLSTVLAGQIQSELSKKNESRTIAGFNPANRYYVISLLAAWKCKKAFLPLCPVHPENELRYFLQDSSAGLILASSQPTSVVDITRLSVPTVQVDKPGIRQESTMYDRTDAVAKDSLVLYTSGTTGRPKGVMHSQIGVDTMISDLVTAWEYSKTDKILHFLPLHHLHGVLNKLLCPLYVGATIEFLPNAHAKVIWDRLAQETHNNKPPVTLFMAVPTVYAKMLEHHREAQKSSSSADQQAQRTAVSAMERMRLMVSGSAALPDNILHAWKELTGHTLLERYGMTEIGMALTNPYKGERKPGYVGKPLPSVQCRIVDDNGSIITSPETAGELRIKGPTVFKEYLNRPKDTAEAFDSEGWFRTGDVATVSQDGDYKLLGRMSADIIKVWYPMVLL